MAYAHGMETKSGLYHLKVVAANGGRWFDFEGLIRDIYVAILRPGDVALDAGVNRGDHLLQMAPAVGPAGLVIGIEPAPAMVALVERYLRDGGLWELRNVILHNVAIADREGTAQLRFVPEQPGLSSMADREIAAPYAVERIDCRVTTIDRLLADVPRRVSFAKLDIEGAEYHAMLGGQRLLRDGTAIVFEYDKGSAAHFGFRTEELLALLHSHDYRVIDFFGFEYSLPEHLHGSGVWNYFAAPASEIDRYRVPEIVAESLAAQGVTLPARTIARAP
jgi:FkbM family methyltransferase